MYTYLGARDRGGECGASPSCWGRKQLPGLKSEPAVPLHFGPSQEARKNVHAVRELLRAHQARVRERRVPVHGGGGHIFRTEHHDDRVRLSVLEL